MKTPCPQCHGLGCPKCGATGMAEQTPETTPAPAVNLKSLSTFYDKKLATFYDKKMAEISASFRKESADRYHTQETCPTKFATTETWEIIALIDEELDSKEITIPVGKQRETVSEWELRLIQQGILNGSLDIRDKRVRGILDACISFICLNAPRGSARTNS